MLYHPYSERIKTKMYWKKMSILFTQICIYDEMKKKKKTLKRVISKSRKVNEYWLFLQDKTQIYWGCPRGIVVNEFELQSRYYVHFRTNTLGKGMNPLILPAMG